MKNILSLESGLMRGMSWIADMVILNLLTILCSLPVITLGAAVTALYDAVGRLQRQEGGLFQAYFRAFRTNFKQATVIWCILLLVGVPLWFCLHYQLQDIQGDKLMSILSFAALALWSFVTAWVFPMQAKFENCVRGTLYNSFILSVAKLPRTMLMVILNGMPWVLLLFPILFWGGLFLWVLIWFSLAAYLNLKLLSKTFDQLIKQ